MKYRLFICMMFVSLFGVIYSINNNADTEDSLMVNEEYQSPCLTTVESNDFSSCDKGLICCFPKLPVWIVHSIKQTKKIADNQEGGKLINRKHTTVKDNILEDPDITDEKLNTPKQSTNEYIRDWCETHPSGVKALGVASLLTFFLIFVVFWATTKSADAETSFVFIDENSPPVAFLALRDWTDSELKGFKSSRLDGTKHIIHNINRVYMEQMKLECAANWLELTMGIAEKKQKEYANAISLKDDSFFLNVNITQRFGQKGVIMSKILFQKTTPARIYHDTVKITHSEGEHTSKSAEEAYCLQELLK